MELALYREVVERIRERNGDVILNLTRGGGRTLRAGGDGPRRGGAGHHLRHARGAHPACRRAEAEICTLDIATMNFGEHLFLNTPAHLRAMAKAIREAGVKPEIEVFDLGHIELARHLIAEGHLARPPLFQLCLGIPLGGAGHARNLVALRARLPKDAVSGRPSASAGRSSRCSPWRRGWAGMSASGWRTTSISGGGSSPRATRPWSRRR